jgi:hypothetical protein
MCFLPAGDSHASRNSPKDPRAPPSDPERPFPIQCGDCINQPSTSITALCLTRRQRAAGPGTAEWLAPHEREAQEMYGEHVCRYSYLTCKVLRQIVDRLLVHKIHQHIPITLPTLRRHSPPYPLSRYADRRGLSHSGHLERPRSCFISGSDPQGSSTTIMRSGRGEEINLADAWDWTASSVCRQMDLQSFFSFRPGADSTNGRTLSRWLRRWPSVLQPWRLGQRIDAASRTGTHGLVSQPPLGTGPALAVAAQGKPRNMPCTAGAVLGGCSCGVSVAAIILTLPYGVDL